MSINRPFLEHLEKSDPLQMEMPVVEAGGVKREGGVLLRLLHGAAGNKGISLCHINDTPGTQTRPMPPYLVVSFSGDGILKSCY